MEKIIDRLDKCLIYLVEQQEKLNSELTSEELRKMLSELAEFKYTPKSNLYALKELYNEFMMHNSSKIDQNILLIDCEALVKKYKLNNLIFNSFKNIELETDMDEHNYLFESYLYFPDEAKYEKFLKVDTSIYSIEKLEKNCAILIMTSYSIIDFFIFDNKKAHRILNSHELNSLDHFTYTKKENTFFDKFINEKASIEDWKYFPTTKFRDYFFLTFDGITQKDWEKLESFQRKLFEEALEIETKILLEELNNVSHNSKLPNAQNQLRIIDTFLSGSFSKLDLERLKNIIDFEDENKVIIELDNLKRYDIYNYNEYLPYNGLYGKRSPIFVAKLLLRYKNIIDNLISSLSQSVKVEKVEDFKEFIDVNESLSVTIQNSKGEIIDSDAPNPKPPSFKLIKKNQKKEKLEKVVHELMRIEFINENKSTAQELIAVFSCDNYSLAKPVHLGNKTNFCCYILKNLTPHFSNLDGASIEKSKLFITKGGSALTQTNYNKSSNNLSLSEQIKREINSIINLLQ